MDKRIQMRSENLQKNFSDVYEKFFLDNNLIVSTSHIIHRGYIFDKQNTSHQIRQKIPTKMFLGINMDNASTEIGFKEITYFSSQQKQFITAPINTIFADINTSYFEKSIKSALTELGYTKGIEISILSESERGTGIEFCGAISVLIAFVISIMTGKIAKESLDNYTTFLSSSICADLYKMAINIFKESKHDKNGTTTFTAISDDRTPIVSTETIDKIAKKIRKNNINVLDLFDIKTSNQPMIDYGIISFGSSYDEYYISSLPKAHASQSEIGSYLNEKLIKSRGEILKSPYNDRAIEDFIGVIIEQGLFGTFIENDHKLFTDIIFLFSQTKEFQDEKIGLMPLTSGKHGGSFLFVTKYKKSRETMEKLLEKLQEIGHHTANYQYLSWEDGFSNEGLKVEQYISQNFFSSYVKNDCAMLQDLGGQTFVGSYNDLLHRQPDGIVFDTINKKIFINGENVTHKDLFTQSATVEIVETLFNNKGHYIKNNELPPSSYSKNKNDMTGKIILPLQQLIEKKFHEKLELTCSGSIVDFNLMLNKGKIPIRLIKKIQ